MFVARAREARGGLNTSRAPSEQGTRYHAGRVPCSCSVTEASEYRELARPSMASANLARLRVVTLVADLGGARVDDERAQLQLSCIGSRNARCLLEGYVYALRARRIVDPFTA
jgi:hypothetical protein